MIFTQTTYSIFYKTGETIYIQLSKTRVSCHCQNLEFLVKEQLNVGGDNIQGSKQTLLNSIQIGLTEPSAYNLSWNMAHNITILCTPSHLEYLMLMQMSVAQLFEAKHNIIKSLSMVLVSNISCPFSFCCMVWHGHQIWYFSMD